MSNLPVPVPKSVSPPKRNTVKPLSVDVVGSGLCDQSPLEHAVMELISDLDFDGYLLTQFDIKIVKELKGTDIQTAALIYAGGRFFVRIVEKFFKELTDNGRVAVMKHEMSHFVNKHFSRCNGRDSQIFNIAGDMAINQDIAHLPKTCIKVPKGWDGNESLEYYYDKIMDKIKKDQKKSPGPGGGGKLKLPAQFDSVMDAPDGGGVEAETMADEIIRETVKSQIDAGIDTSKLRGLHAGALEKYIDELTKPPMIDWRHALTRFAATLADQVSRRTLKRPDRRELGPYGKRREYLPKVIVCVDTSGSVSDDMLSLFFSQISLLSNRLSEIAVIIADAAVQEHFTYKKGMENKLRQMGLGRGGTDFEPAVQYINKNLRDWDGAVYLTDGWCPEPDTRCRVPMIWIVTENKEFPGRPKIFSGDSSKRGKNY